MKLLILIAALWPTVVFSQAASLYSVGPGERIDESFLANFRGIGQQEVLMRVWESETQTPYVVILDVTTRQEVNKLAITLRNPSGWLKADLNGDKVSELVIVNEIYDSSASSDNPGLVVCQWKDNIIRKTEVSDFSGIWGHTGDVTGDGRDEVILCSLPIGHTNPGGTGPIDIEVLSWNGRDFDLLAKTSMRETYLRTKVIDLNADGRDEIVAFRSGQWDKDYTDELDPQLGVYRYDETSELELIDEVAFPVVQDGNLNRLWTQPLENGEHRIVIPLPVEFEEGRDDWPILRYQGFRLEGNQLIRETELLSFEWDDYNKAPITYPPAPAMTLKASDGSSEIIQVRDRRQLQLRKLPAALPK